MRLLALVAMGALVASAQDSTGPLHRRTVERLSAPPAVPAGETADLSAYSVALDWAPFASADEAALAEAAIDWFDLTPGGAARQDACTLAFAAGELRQYLRRMSRCEDVAPIRPLAAGPQIVVSTLARLPKALAACLPATIRETLRGGPQRFAVVPAGAAVLLVGSDRVGTLYAVYDFLEAQGVRFVGLGPGSEHVPETRRLRIPTAYAEKPGFGLRSLYGYRKNRGTEEFVAACAHPPPSSRPPTRTGRLNFTTW